MLQQRFSAQRADQSHDFSLQSAGNEGQSVSVFTSVESELPCYCYYCAIHKCIFLVKLSLENTFGIRSTEKSKLQSGSEAG